MKAQTAQQYIGMTCRIHYETRLPSWRQTPEGWVKYMAVIPHMRAGVVTNTTFRKLILLAFNGETDDFEYYIAIKNIKRIYELKT